MHGNYKNYTINDKHTLEEYYWGQCLSIKQIAKIIGCSPNTVQSRIKKHQIQTRPFSMAGLTPYNKGKKGGVPWNKGLKGGIGGRKGKKYGVLSAEHKEKLRKASTGRKHTSETIAKISGNNSPHWKGGITKASKLERHKFRNYIQKKVFERDDYTCQMCETKGVPLQVDHIQPWAEYLELRFKIENCRTLCMRCHYMVTYGKPMPPSVRAWGHNFKGGSIL